MANYQFNMLTSTPPMVPKTAASVSAAHGYGVDYAHHLQHQHQHQDDQGQESPLPQPQPQSPSPSHFNHTEAARGASEAHLQNTDSGMFARIHSKSASLGSSSSSPQQQRRQSILRHFKTNDVEQIQDAPLSHTKAMSAPPTAQHLETGQDIRPEDRRLVVRLDLRKLGTGLGELRGSRKHSLRRHSKQKPADDVKAGSAHPPTVQTTLSASSWSLAKRAPEPLVQSNSARGSASTPPHLYQTVEGFPAIIADGYTSASTPALDQTTLGNSLFKHHSDAPEHSSDAAGDSRSDDEDYADTCPQAVKRHSPSRASRDPISKKRTRTPDQGTAKKKKLDEDTRRQQPHRPGAGTVKKESSKKPPKGSLALKDAVSVKGDELALKYNKDYCEACMGLGEFICCDTCPKAFHFSCCQPPVDPLHLPDEWDCNECYAKKNPPPPSQAGIFKELMDNVNRSNPKAFVLPPEIQSFFKGVMANSDGEYEDTLDQKPKTKRSNSNTPSATLSRAEENSLQLQDTHGSIRLCYQCNKSALGGRWMISCDHCPLHWHLDCLSPPMASPPPISRKWMCPNHADHVLPRRRKRKDAVPLRVDDPEAPNDGDIEVIPDPETTENKRSIWDTDTSGVLFRVPERSIKLSFIEKCQR
ncbi:hypothetical protein EDD21DRAFT_353396 [Dissophora ornata]|nr:hypothetical protein EDD21DRAFT_353396 [Dissophora ornata]